METMVNNFINATGWSIFHSLWQGALIYGILLVLVTALPKLSSRTKHNLAYAALCLMFAGFCITFFSLFNLASESGKTVPANIYPPLIYASYLSELPSGWRSFTEGLFPYIVAIYGLGLVIQIIVLLSGYQKIKKLKNADRLYVPEDWALAFAEIRSALKISREVGFSLSQKVNVPLVIGYFKPVVLFPVALATQLELKQVEAILIHELSHIRRNDYLFNLAKTVMETVLFFNPFVWLSGKLINIEREHACDDLVLKHTGAPLTYAHALLKLELIKSKDAPALSLAATGKTQHLYQRIKRITDMKTNYMNAKQRLLAISLTIATVISLAWASPLKSEEVIENARKKMDNMIKAPVFQSVKEISETVRLEAAAVAPNQDTIKKKTRVKIVTTDEKGNTKEYNSLKEMPDSLRRDVMVRVMPGPARPGRMADSLIILHGEKAPRLRNWDFDPADSRKIAEEARKQAEEIRKYYNSEEWKKKLEEIALDAAKNAKDYELHFSAPEFREQMREFRVDGEKLREKLNSGEWKKEMDKLKEFLSSKEYKDLKEKQKKEIEKLKKKKGIDTKIGDAISIPVPTSLPYAYFAPVTPKAQVPTVAPEAPIAPAPATAPRTPLVPAAPVTTLIQ